MNKRLFLAIDLPQNLKDELVAFQKNTELIHQFSSVKFRRIPLENFHITVSFLGYIPYECIDGLIETVQALCKQFKPFPFSFSHFQFAPSGRPPTMIWAVFESDRIFQTFTHEVNLSMRNFLRSVDRNIHFTFHGVFTPHVTLIRLNGDIGNKDLPLFEIKEKKCEVKELILYESKLAKVGATYSRLAVFPFGNQS